MELVKTGTVKVRNLGTTDFKKAPYLDAIDTPILGVPDGSAICVSEGEIFGLGEPNILSVINGSAAISQTEKTSKGKRLVLRK